MLLKHLALALIALTALGLVEGGRKKTRSAHRSSSVKKIKVSNHPVVKNHSSSRKVNVKSKINKVRNNIKVKTERNNKNIAINNNNTPLANNIANSKVAATSNRNKVLAQHKGIASENAMDSSETVQNSVTLNNSNSQDHISGSVGSARGGPLKKNKAPKYVAPEDDSQEDYQDGDVQGAPEDDGQEQVGGDGQGEGEEYEDEQP